MLLGKIKIHEIAKKLNLTSKEVLEVAKKLNIEAKSHLSGVDEEQATKIEKELLKNTSKDKVQTPKENTKKAKKEEKKETPVIIRREVIIEEEQEKKEKEKAQKQQKRNNNVGFVERKQNKDYNIVYRNKPNKPMTVSELFGLKKEEQKKPVEEVKEEPKKEIEEVKETAKEELVKEKKEEIKQDKSKMEDINTNNTAIKTEDRVVENNS